MMGKALTGCFRLASQAFSNTLPVVSILAGKKCIETPEIRKGSGG